MALALVAAIGYRATILPGESDQWVRHTQDVLEKLQDLHVERPQKPSQIANVKRSGR